MWRGACRVQLRQLHRPSHMKSERTSVKRAALEAQLRVDALLRVAEQDVVTLREHLLKAGALQLPDPWRVCAVPAVDLLEGAHIEAQLVAHHVCRRLHSCAVAGELWYTEKGCLPALCACALPGVLFLAVVPAVGGSRAAQSLI